MEDEKKESSINERLPVEVRAQMLQGEASIFLNMAKFEHAQRVANMLIQGKMWPESIRTVGDALIVLNMADRMKADPFMLAQRIYIVHGKPGLEGKLVISLINNSGKYAEPLRFEFSSKGDKEPSEKYDTDQDDKMDKAYGCRAITVDKRSGKVVTGPKITWKIVKDEGWYGKQGSKWKTMAELMFQYRSASWFANINCPEVTLGLPTADELRDVVDLHPDVDGKYQIETERKPITFNDETAATTDKTRKPRSDKGKPRGVDAATAATENAAPPAADTTGAAPTVNGKDITDTKEWAHLLDLKRSNTPQRYLQSKVDLHMPQGPSTLEQVNAMISYLEKPAQREPGE